MKNKTIVGIGEILFDLLPQGPQLGGAPANFAYHVSRLGGAGVAVSAVGKDELGADILHILASKNLDAILPQVEHPTGTVEVSLDEKGIPAYTIIEGVAWDNVPFSTEMEVLAAEAGAVCFGTLAQRSPVTRNTIRQFIRHMPEDSLKVYDINLRQHFFSKEIVDASLRIADILKINDEEIATVSALLDLDDNPETACRQLIGRYGLRLVILTKGGDGSEVITPGEVLSLRCPQVDIADTVGAGDAFTAAFILAYLRGDSLKDCHALANEVSAFVCSRSGAMPEYDRTF